MKKQASNMNSRILLSAPHMSGEELEFINEAIESNWVAPLGPFVNGFERDLEAILDSKSNVVALNSGTSAIHLALVLLKIGKDDEVICQTKTFAASVNPVLYVGAKPIFIDSENETWNMCPILLEKAIQDRINKGKKPKAIIAINLYGMPYNVTNIHDISTRYNIPVIEDSAEAIGSFYDHKPCGTFGDYSIFSFNGNKIITTSGGGALITRSKEDKQKAIFLATQAKENGLEYNHKTIGYNYRMSNILAAIGRAQIRVLGERVNKRREIFNYYKMSFKDIKAVTFLEEPEKCYSNRWLTCIVLKNEETRDNLISILEDNNIESRPSWKPMHLQEVFEKYPSYLNGVSDQLYKTGLCLPSGSNLTNKDLDRVITVIKNYFG